MFSRIAILGLALTIFAGFAQAQAHDYRAGSLTIDHPWSRATPGGAKVGAGYLTITNSGGEDRLVSVAAGDIAGRAEIHEVVMKDGVMSMQHRPDGLPVPAKGTLVLKPRSFHLMFLDLKRPLVEGESFAGTLTFEKAGKIEVRFEVEPVGAMAPKVDDHDHMQMGH